MIPDLKCTRFSNENLSQMRTGQEWQMRHILRPSQNANRPRDLDSVEMQIVPVENQIVPETQTQSKCKSSQWLKTQIVPALTDELRRPPWRGSSNPLAGHCYVASEAAWHALGGSSSAWVPQHIRHEGAPHWYLRHAGTGEILDLTAGQFRTVPDYSQGRGKGFLTRQPSRRARIVLERIGEP